MPMYRIKLVEISEHLTKEQLKKLLYCGKNGTPESSSSITTPDEIFRCLEEEEIISFKKVRFLKKFAKAIGRIDLVAKLTRFEITRELMIYALNRQGLEATMNSSTMTLGHRLAEMVDVVQDRVDVPVQGSIRSLLRPGQDISNILDVIIGEAPPSSEISTSWNALALRVTAAAEIVWFVIREDQEQENGITNALRVAKKLASHLLSETDKVGTWEKFCRFVMEQHQEYFCPPVTESAPDFPCESISSLIGKLKDTFFTDKRSLSREPI